jgi:hypothetical protein
LRERRKSVEIEDERISTDLLVSLTPARPSAWSGTGRLGKCRGRIRHATAREQFHANTEIRVGSKSDLMMQIPANTVVRSQGVPPPVWRFHRQATRCNGWWPSSAPGCAPSSVWGASHRAEPIRRNAYRTAAVGMGVPAAAVLIFQARSQPLIDYPQAPRQHCAHGRRR